VQKAASPCPIQGNVVAPWKGPKYGRYRRLYTLFADPPKRSGEWSEGARRRLRSSTRFRLVDASPSAPRGQKPIPASTQFGKSLLRRLIRHSARHAGRRNGWHFTLPSLDHGFLQRNHALLKGAPRTTFVPKSPAHARNPCAVLEPMTPHLAKNLEWLGHKKALDGCWPNLIPTSREEEVEI